METTRKIQSFETTLAQRGHVIFLKKDQIGLIIKQ